MSEQAIEPYCAGRTYYDADGHIMEHPGWVEQFADKDIADKLKLPKYNQIDDQIALHEMFSDDDVWKLTPEKIQRAEENVMIPKSYNALGAIDPQQRSRALDLIGLDAQLIFSTLSSRPFVSYVEMEDWEMVYGYARAVNRGLAEFCQHDSRLYPVGILTLHQPHLALKELKNAVKEGIKGIMLPATPVGDKSPGHPDFDPIWRYMEESNTPFYIHIGGQNLRIKKAYVNNGGPMPKDFRGGELVMIAKDLCITHHEPEEFISAMVLDGVLDRFPKLHGATVELGASFAPGLMKRLESLFQTWRKKDPVMTTFKRTPYEQIVEQLAFTPFTFEDVGDLIRTSEKELFLFSTDYPHPEGGRDPMKYFNKALEQSSEEEKECFFSRNFAKLYNYQM